MYDRDVEIYNEVKSNEVCSKTEEHRDTGKEKKQVFS